EDVTYIKITQYALVGLAHPSFTFEAVLYKNIPAVGTHANAFLDARAATKFRGKYKAVEPLKTFYDVLSVLKRDRFFDARMHPATALYLDGPEDEITVASCGVATTIGTVGNGTEVNLDDAQAHAFFDLESDLRTRIFSIQWAEQKPTPSHSLDRLRQLEVAFASRSRRRGLFVHRSSGIADTLLQRSL
ncbi:MAG: hypothetical protein M3160_10910, partial [Candidatus Eremiobacteraeota bacterium]|nr:hypothetical protein [Candidatus Eremiobacteraeota bacterium]